MPSLAIRVATSVIARRSFRAVTSGSAPSARTADPTICTRSRPPAARSAAHRGEERGPVGVGLLGQRKARHAGRLAEVEAFRHCGFGLLAEPVRGGERHTEVHRAQRRGGKEERTSRTRAGARAAPAAGGSCRPTWRGCGTAGSSRSSGGRCGPPRPGAPASRRRAVSIALRTAAIELAPVDDP